MDRKGITRSEFLREGSCMAAGALFANVAAAGAANCQAAPCQQVGAGAGRCGFPGGLAMRPYQVLCMFCRLGEQESPPKEGKLGEVYEAIRETPDMPVTLCANAGDVYVYQDPGAAEDTPEGRDFNRKRDLDILQRMSWPPGITLPARTLLSCVLDKITTTAGLCGYDRVTSDAWKGCPKANSGRYEKGREKGIHALIAPRGEAEMAREFDEGPRSIPLDLREDSFHAAGLHARQRQAGGLVGRLRREQPQGGEPQLRERAPRTDGEVLPVDVKKLGRPLSIFHLILISSTPPENSGWSLTRMRTAPVVTGANCTLL